MVLTNCSGCFISASRKLTGPFTFVPSASCPDGSMGPEKSFFRHSPVASKFSSENPSGSITAWHEAQLGLARCCSMSSRTERGFAPSSFSFNGGTPGGGGGGGVPRIFSRIHLPRKTGDVRLGYDVTVRTLPCPSNPHRTGSVRVTRRNWLP